MSQPVSIKINEIFLSIQGESSLAGKPTTFVRTATCNLRCRWCDTRYAFWEGELLTVEKIMEEVRKNSTRYVCLTGGEPLGQRGIYPLMEKLLEEKYTVSLETGGGFSVKGVPPAVIKVVDIKCPDSGETENMVWENLDIVDSKDQLKFVINSRTDFEWAQKLVRDRSLEKKCELLFSPVYGKVRPADLARWILDDDAQVTMQTQLHKEIWGPEKRGV